MPWENPKPALKVAQQQNAQAKVLGKGVEKEPARDIKALFHTKSVSFPGK